MLCCTAFDKFLFGLWSDSFHKPAAVITATAVPESTSSKLVKHADSKLDRFHQGWIPLAKITSFKRMSGYLEPAPTGLGGIDEVAKALEASTEVEAKKFGEEGQEGAGWYVRKTAELARPVDVLDRSIYAKGFPIEEPKDDSEEAKKAVRDAELDLQKRMENWARSLNAGKVLSLRMRREDKPATGDRKNTVKGGGKFKVRAFGIIDTVSRRADSLPHLGIHLPRVRQRRKRRQIPRYRPQAYLRGSRARDPLQVSLIATI